MVAFNKYCLVIIAVFMVAIVIILPAFTYTRVLTHSLTHSKMVTEHLLVPGTPRAPLIHWETVQTKPLPSRS